MDGRLNGRANGLKEGGVNESNEEGREGVEGGGN